MFAGFSSWQKSSGGRTIGVFQHISGVPGPSQILGLCHLILGREERQQYIHHLGEKVRAFYEELGIPHPGNSYYGLINLGDIESENSAQKPIEQVLTTLAETRRYPDARAALFLF